MELFLFLEKKSSISVTCRGTAHSSSSLAGQSRFAVPEHIWVSTEEERGNISLLELLSTENTQSQGTPGARDTQPGAGARTILLDTSQMDLAAPEAGMGQLSVGTARYAQPSGIFLR